MHKRGSVISFPLKDKKGISVMIGYILLITFAIAIAAIVYQWLSSYVPQEDISCPEGVSIYVSGSDQGSNQLNLTVQNNGRFNISGIYIRYSEDSSQDVATNDLSSNITEATIPHSDMNPGIRLGPEGETDKNLFAPEQEVTMEFDISNTPIHSIQIVPTRTQTENNELTTVSCTNAQTEKIL